MNQNYFFFTNQLNETETRVITSILGHIENNESKISIAQIAAENYVSTSFIVKMCKRLGYSGYTDFVYHLSSKREAPRALDALDLGHLLDNYSQEDVRTFLGYLREYRNRKIFVVGAGFADMIAVYMTQRMAVSGFMVFSHVHFYDYMVFKKSNASLMESNIEPSLIIAISQSGETEVVINDIKRARQHGFRVACFTRTPASTLAALSDVTFLVVKSDQVLLSPVPNPFFGKVILAFEELLGLYFRQE